MTRTRLLGSRRQGAGSVPACLPGPDALEVGSRTLRAGGVLHQTLAVTGYPREVGPGWLQPLLDHPGPIDVAVYVEPVATVVAAERLRRQLARLESSQRLDAAQGRLDDPQLDAATHDAHQLARRLATGEGRLLRVGLYVTVRGHTPAELDHEVARVQGLLGSLLLDAHPVTFRALQGWLTTLPLGLDQLRLHRTMDTAAVAACFPFASADLPLPATGGVLLGRNLRTQGLVGWDRWAQPNFNQVLLARSGAGKSYLAKLEALRWLYQGVQVLVVDPKRIPAARAGGRRRLPAAWRAGGAPQPLRPRERAGCADPPRAVRPHPAGGAARRPAGPGRERGGGSGGDRRLHHQGDHQRPAHPPPPRPPPG
jgi:hypothetical protein